MVIVLVVLLNGTELNVTLHDAPEGSPISVKVTTYDFCKKFAVRVPGPFMVIVVEADVGLDIFMEEALDDHEENAELSALNAVAETATTDCSLKKIEPDGAVEPPLDEEL
jgi:ribosomal protein L11